MVFSSIPQVVTEDRASGAQFTEGSLKFDSGKSTHLQRTQVGGTRKTFTWSGWIKRTDSYNGNNHHDWFSASEGDTTSGGDYGFGLRFAYNKSHSTIPYQLMVFEYENSAFKLRLVSDQVFRDFNNFYHVVIAVDTTIASPASDRVKVYVNGERITNWKSGSNYETYPTQNLELTVNESGKTSQIGCSVDESGVVQQADGYASNFYLIDGQQLGPEEFGFTDGLTGTWRPKKYNKSGPNNGTTWSSSGSSSASLQNGSWSQVFDGTQYMYGGSGPSNGPALANGSITFAPSGLSGRVITAGVRGGSNKTYTVNGQAMTFGSGAAEVATIDLGSTQTIASVVGTSTDSGTWAQFFWIAVDGVLLVDGLNDLKAFGKNGFYLPMDGNTPIGKDQSGNGNDFTPINFGGSAELPKATGAIPILNTNEAGTVAKGGVRTDSKIYTVTASGGNYYLDGALKPTLNAYRGGSYTFDYTGASSHPLYLSSLPDGKHNSKAYSVEFNGTGSSSDTDYLSIPSSSDFAFGTGDFTIEYFLYLNSTPSTVSVPFDMRPLNTNGAYPQMSVDSTLTLKYYTNTNYRITGTTGGIPLNKWVHIALSRSGTSTKMFVDGIQTGNTYSDSINYLQSGFTISSNQYSTSEWGIPGSISNFRVIKGTALYTSNFTPPSTTLTNVTGTTLLCCQDSNATTGAVLPSGSTISANGNAAATNSRNPFLYNTNGQEGVNTGTSNTTKITIPHWAADTLYYYCNAHSGMGSSINVTTDIFKADPYAWKCVYAVPLVGTASDESTSLNVNSDTKAITITGASSSMISNFYGGSFNFSSGNSQYLTTADSSDFDFGNGEFTIEAFIEGPLPGSRTNSVVLNQSVSGAASNSAFYFGCGNDGVSLYLSTNGTSWTNNIEHSQILGMTGWHHIVWQRRSNTLEIYVDGIRVKTGSFSGTINNSSRVVEIGRQSTSGSYFNGRIQDVRVYKGIAKYTETFIPASTSPDILPDTSSGITGKTNLAKITDGAVSFDGSGDFLQVPASEDLNVGSADFTAEAWVYPTTYGEIVGAFNLNAPYNGWLWGLSFGSLGKQMIWFNGNQQESTSIVPKNKWSHIAFSKSGTTVKYFLDGKLDGSFTASADSTWSNQAVNIGADSNSLTSPGRNFGGFISNLRLIKGTALYTSEFTPPTEPLTAVTNTKLLCCQSTTSAVAAAVAPGSITANGDAAATNFNPFTDDINAIRGQATGYATLNPLDARSTVTLSEGNLVHGASSNNISNVRSTISLPSTGKYYFEYKNLVQTSGYPAVGMAKESVSVDGNYNVSGSFVIRNIVSQSRRPGFEYDGNNHINMTPSATPLEPGDIISVLVDMDKLKAYVGINNKLYGRSDATTMTVVSISDVNDGTNPAYELTSGEKYFAWASSYGTSATGEINFGQKPFKFPPPDGFQPLNLSNVQPEKVIARPDQYVAATLFTGTGDAVSSRTVELPHAADLVWAKSRDRGSSNQLLDTVRGNNLVLQTNSTMNDRNPTTQYTGGGLSTIDGKTVTIASGTTNNQNLNVNGNRGVIWSWKAGGSKGTFNVDDVGYASAAAAGLNGGTITPTGASVGTKQGFSILMYQGNGTPGANISHGLSEAPKLMIHKSIDQSRNWYTITTVPDGQSRYGYVNLTNQFNGSSVVAPTSTLMNFTGSQESNNSGENYIVYMWHDVPGLQKIGTWTNNNSNDGTFIELGFKPALILLKNTDNVENWYWIDSSRHPYNEGVPNNDAAGAVNTLQPNTQNTEATSRGFHTNATVDILSNGFKIRSTNTGAGEISFGTRNYIYAAWAEAPSMNLYGAQANAR